jgi:hypothetical protein
MAHGRGPNSMHRSQSETPFMLSDGWTVLSHLRHCSTIAIKNSEVAKGDLIFKNVKFDVYLKCVSIRGSRP